ncbi:omega-3 polyunsaturated fatty acid synthase PfaB [Shewanella algicola]|uniref:PfaB family protein n=1 Tax=Shewanella algicola TaxID=640633 RepID=A0A9X2CB17_9GAMM|nr:PfaB family protein [Shewanella algicola]MCL1104018.1 PfaB family protein [Shewanella algicola]GGP38339.1 omega-3 polyunsaturated fatty acid synthase PfaB [Shewanella algicola]
MTFSVNAMSADQQAALTTKLTADLKQQQAKPMRLALLLAAPDANSVSNLSIKHQPLDAQLLDDQLLEALLLDAAGLLGNHSCDIVNLNDKLWIMPAITAAKNGLHAHAYLNGIGCGDKADQAMAQALAHAKRQYTQPQAVELTQANNALNALVALIKDIAYRRVPNSQDFWFTPAHQSRVASLCYPSNIGVLALVLTQGSQLLSAKPLLATNRLMLPLSAQNIANLHTQLTTVSNALSEPCDELSLLKFIRQQWQQYQLQTPYALVLMATSQSGLQQEASAMLAALEAQQTQHSTTLNNTRLHYKTPAGSCLTTSPLGANGLSFVYPGVGTVYPQMFSQLGHVFPQVFAKLEAQGDLPAMLQTQAIYATAEKNNNHMSLSELAIAGVGASYMLSKILQDEFEITPAFALGYSMGEAAMWASLGVWQAPHQLIDSTQNSSIFNQDISGELRCVRQAWQLANDEPIVWNSFVTRATVAEISPHLADYPRAYIAIIQGDSLVLAGCEQSCKALLKQAGKRGIAANRVTAMHTPAALNIIDDVKQFYLQPLAATLPTSTQFLSAAQKQPIELTSHAIAQSIADTFCHPLNFSQLISDSISQGCRLFVEVGADRQTATLIDKIIGQQTTDVQAQALAVNAKGADDINSLLKCLAQLMTHRVPMSLTPFTQNLNEAIEQQTLFIAANSFAVEHGDTLLEGEPH